MVCCVACETTRFIGLSYLEPSIFLALLMVFLASQKESEKGRRDKLGSVLVGLFFLEAISVPAGFPPPLQPLAGAVVTVATRRTRSTSRAQAS